LPVRGVSETITPPQSADGLPPPPPSTWRPEVDPEVPQPVLNAVQWLQTSARPSQAAVKNDSSTVHEDGADSIDKQPTSIAPVTGQQPVLDASDRRRTLDSKWSANQYLSPSKGVERRASVSPAHLINSESDERIDDVFPNKNRSENNCSLFQAFRCQAFE